MSDFLSLHVKGEPLLMPNPWDAGSARLLQHLGFLAVATTSSGAGAAAGRLDGGLSRDEAIAAAATIAAAVDIPVSADLENCFADDPEGVAGTVRLARDAGLAGCSVEDWDPVRKEIYPFDLAVDRVLAAVDAADGLVVTARAEGMLRGGELGDTIARLQAFEAAGAPVVFAPGVHDGDQIRSIVDAVAVPVNVLVVGGSPTIAELAAIGVARVSTGGGLAYAAYGALIDAATELRDQGTYGYWEQVARARDQVRGALRS